MDLFSEEIKGEELEVKTSYDKTLPNRIESVTWENYRNLNETKDFKGLDFNFTGINGIGKTNHLEGIIFALNGKMLDNSSITNIVPREMPLDTKVSVSVKLTSGTIIKREYKQSVKVDGETGEKVLGTASQTLYINGEKQKSLKDGQNLIYVELGLNELNVDMPKDIDVIMLLTVTEYFKTLQPKVLRELFEKMVGDIPIKEIYDGIQVSNKDVIEYFKELKYDLDTIKKNSTTKVKELKSKIDTLMNTIERNKIDDVEQESLNSELGIKNDRIHVLSDLIVKEKTLIEGDKQSALNALELEKANVSLQLKEETERMDKEFEATKGDGFKKQIQETVDKAVELKSEYNETNKRIAELEKTKVSLEEEQETQILKKETLENKLVLFREQYANAKKPKTITCPCCDKVFDLNGVGEFKAILDNTLKDITKQATSVKSDISEIEKRLVDIESELETVFTKSMEQKQRVHEIIEVGKKNKELQTELVSKQENLPTKPSYNSKLYSELSKKFVELQKQINDYKPRDDKQLKEYQQELQTLNNEVIEIRTKLNTSTVQDEKELELARKDLNKYEQALALVSNATKNKLQILDERVKTIFGENIEVKLFDYAEDGSIKAVLEINVKDKYGKFTPLINGINSGYYPIRVVELTNFIRKKYNIRDTFVLADGLESLDDDSRLELSSLRQQIIGTRVVVLQEVEETLYEL